MAFTTMITKMIQSKYNTFGLTIKSCSDKWHSLQMQSFM